MPKLIKLPVYKDNRGSLTVIEKILPFVIKRVYYIYQAESGERGHHSHKKTTQALISVSGSCQIHVKNKKNNLRFDLNSPTKCLLIDPYDFHWMNNFSKDCVLLVLASHYYNENDYLD